jgi:hypothetical protein
MLSDIDRVCSTSRPIGADSTVARVLAPDGASPRTTAAPGAPRASASADPASIPGWPLRAREPGLTRAPSTAVAVTGAAYVEGASPVPQPAAVRGPLKRELSTTMRVTGVPAGSAATTWVARSSTVAAPA